jgi:hypothetical protein
MSTKAFTTALAVRLGLVVLVYSALAVRALS